MSQTPETPNTVNELMDMNKSQEPNLEVLLEQFELLNPEQTARLARLSVQKLVKFHHFIVNKKSDELINREVSPDQMNQLHTWLLDMKSWQVIYQEMMNISDFCDD